MMLIASLLTLAALASNGPPDNPEKIFVCEESLLKQLRPDEDPWDTEYNEAEMLERETVYIDERTALEHVLWEEKQKELRWLQIAITRLSIKPSSK